MTTTTYEKHDTLTDFIGIESIEYEADPYFMATLEVAAYETEGNEAGSFWARLYSGWRIGPQGLEPCFVEDAQWVAAHPYNASGYRRRLLSIEEGVALLIKDGNLLDLWGAPPKAA